MRVLFDICHPAHVHFFKHAILQLKQAGHAILITSRKKECTETLLDAFEFEHHPLYARSKSSFWGFAKELICRDRALLKVVKEFKPDLMVAIGGTFIAHARFFSCVPALVFYDSDNATLQNLITYPFASRIYQPKGYQGWTLSYKTHHYAGFHELAYLHPKYFQADKKKALLSGLDPSKPTFLIRLVGWHATHDRGQQGLCDQAVESCIQWFEKRGKVLISSERPLPKKWQHLAYQGAHHHLHHLMAYCHACLGESPTMASESAMLGVPAVYVSSIQAGYIKKLSQDFGLILSLTPQGFSIKRMEKFLEKPSEYWEMKKTALINHNLDVTDYVVKSILSYPKSIELSPCKNV